MSSLILIKRLSFSSLFSISCYVRDKFYADINVEWRSSRQSKKRIYTQNSEKLQLRPMIDYKQLENTVAFYGLLISFII